MAPPLVDRSTGNTIPAADHNDVKDYIEDGTYRVNTKALEIQGVGEVISDAGVLANLTGPITLFDSGILTSPRGGTANGFTKFTGPASAERTFTLPNANATLLYAGGDLGTPSAGVLTNCTFPTLNQNTSGSAATLTTGRDIEDQVLMDLLR